VPDRPPGARPHGRGLRRRGVVPLTERSRGIAVVLENFGDRRAVLADRARIAVPIHRPFGDGARLNPMMIAAGSNAARLGERIDVV
jgi:hypothetical protein